MRTVRKVVFSMVLLAAAMVQMMSTGCASRNPADAVLLSNAHGRACVSLTGANVTSYVPAGGQEVFFRAVGFSVEDAAFAHGGMPIAWPWFGRKDGSNDGELIHGYARRLRWTVRERTDSRVVMVVESGDSTRRFDGRDFRLTYAVELGESLDVVLTMENTGKEDLPIGTGLHPFFKVSDNTKLRLEGVRGISDIPEGVDKVFPFADGTCELVDKGFRRRIVLTTSGGNGLCVWNDAAQWPDIYAPGGAREFCCVEPIILGKDEGRAGLRLAPGAQARLALSIRVKGE